MRLADELLNIPKECLDRIAWIRRDLDASLIRRWTWADVKSITASAASFLAEHSVGSGDRVVNLGRNSLAWAVLDIACSALNAVHVPIDSRFSPSFQSQCIELIEPKLVFSDALIGTNTHNLEGLLKLPRASMGLEQLVRPFREDDLANILFTSGTTGNPRGVMLSHKNLMSNANAKLDAMPQVYSDHRLNFLPFSHAYARTCELTTWLISRSCIEVATGVDGVLENAKAAQPTLINGVPIFYDRLVSKWNMSRKTKSGLHEILGSRIRRLASGGASLSNAVRSLFSDVGMPIFQGYGLTECSPVICSNRVGVDVSSAILTEVGPPVKGVKIKIDSDSRLWVSGDGVMLGYWREKESTQKKIVGKWLDTGDLAEIVPNTSSRFGESAIRILGRADDTIVLSSGYKVQPFPIEQILNSQPWVSQCMLVGQNRPHTSLLLKLNTSAEEVDFSIADYQAKVDELLCNFPRYAIPKQLVFMEEGWTIANGMANFKGGLNRKRIAARFNQRINDNLA